MKNILRTEDEELQEFILAECDTAIPLEIYRREGGAVTEVMVYPCCLPVVSSLLKDDPDLFSDDNIGRLQAILTPFMKERGFVPSPDGVPCICEFRTDSPDVLRRRNILPGTVLIPEPSDPEGADDCLSARHIVDGREVASAGLNDLAEDETVEIHVECLPAFRRQGYATSCVARLTEYYTENGVAVRYLCRSGNLASMRIAEKNRFHLEGIRLSFVYYRCGTV